LIFIVFCAKTQAARINATGKHEEIIMPNTNKSAVEIEYNLETPIRHDLFEYILS